MSNIAELANVPEVSFIDDTTQEQLTQTLMADYAQRYEDITGKSAELAAADPVRLCLLSIAWLGNQMLQYIDMKAKMGLLKYSAGDYLDNVAALKGIRRNPAACASCTMKFSMSSARSSVTGIPAGTRVSNAAGVYFMTDDYVEIPIGGSCVTVSATALTAGEAANALAVGSINTIVDPVPYIATVQNTTESVGGAEIESDDSLTYRVYMAPAGYSVAGPTDAYVYHAKQFRADVADAIAYSPAPGYAAVIFMLENGVAPSETEIAAMRDYLSGDTIRPTTDFVVADAPTDVTYNIALAYYIKKSDSAKAASIQAAVTAAISAYKAWQRKIGRDINPSELIGRIMAAGAKRVALTAPTHTVVEIGKALTQSFTGNGTATGFTVTAAPPSIDKVTVSGSTVVGWAYNPTTGVLTLERAPEASAAVVVSYSITYIPALGTESVTYGGLEDD